MINEQSAEETITQEVVEACIDVIENINLTALIRTTYDQGLVHGTRDRIIAKIKETFNVV